MIRDVRVKRQKEISLIMCIQENKKITTKNHDGDETDEKKSK